MSRPDQEEMGAALPGENTTPGQVESQDALVVGVNAPSRPLPVGMLARAVAAGVFAGGRALIEHQRVRMAPASNANAETGDLAAEVMSVDEAAAFLGLDRNTIYDAAGRDEIPHRRIGKRILLSRTQLVAWLGACKAARVGNG